jgi:hypothetical protein
VSKLLCCSKIRHVYQYVSVRYREVVKLIAWYISQVSQDVEAPSPPFYNMPTPRVRKGGENYLESFSFSRFHIVLLPNDRLGRNNPYTSYLGGRVAVIQQGTGVWVGLPSPPLMTWVVHVTYSIKPPGLGIVLSCHRTIDCKLQWDVQLNCPMLSYRHSTLLCYYIIIVIMIYSD